MPLHPDFEEVKKNMVSKYGAEKGEKVYYQWLKSRGYDDTKAMPKSKSYTGKIKSFNFEGEPYVEGYITASVFDDQGDLFDDDLMEDISRQINEGNIKLGFWHTEVAAGVPELIPCGLANKAHVEIVDGIKKVWVHAPLNSDISYYPQLKSWINKGFIDSFSVELYKDDFFELPDYGSVVSKGKIRRIALTGDPVNQEAKMTAYLAKSGDLNNSSLYTENLEKSVMTDGSLDNSETRNLELKASEEKKCPKCGEVMEDEKKHMMEKHEGDKMDEKTEMKSEAVPAAIAENLATKSNELNIEALKSAVADTIRTEMKSRAPMTNFADKFEDASTSMPAPLQEYEEKVLKKAEEGRFFKAYEVDEMYASAAKAVNYIYQGGLAPGQKIQAARSLKSFGFNRQSLTMMDVEGRDVSVGQGQNFLMKSRPFAMKAILDHTSNQASLAYYYQSAAEIGDYYSPAYISQLNDDTVLYGVLRKVDASNSGDRYNARVRTGRVNASVAAIADYSASDTTTPPTAGFATFRKISIPFQRKWANIQLDNFAIESAKGEGGVGDLIGWHVQAMTADLLRDMNEDLFGAADGDDDGDAGMGLQYLVDDSSNYATLYGYTRTSGNVTTLQGVLISGSSNDPSFDLLRQAIRTVRINGARIEDLFFVTHHLQADKIRRLMQAQQINDTETARAGFVGQPRFMGVPIFEDDQCTNSRIYLLDQRHTYIVVKLAPTLFEIPSVYDSRRLSMKTYWNLFSDAPNHNAHIHTLSTS